MLNRTNTRNGQVALSLLLGLLPFLAFVFLWIIVSAVFSLTPFFTLVGDIFDTTPISIFLIVVGLVLILFAFWLGPRHLVLYFGLTFLLFGMAHVFGRRVSFIILALFIIWFFYVSLNYGPVPGAIFVVMIVVLLLLMATGWAAIIDSKVTDVAVTVGATVPIERTLDVLGNQFSNLWLLISDPQKWYENQYVKKGERDEGATSQAVEILKLDILPEAVGKEETVSVLADVENKGQADARDIKFFISVDDKVKDYGGGVIVNGNRNAPATSHMDGAVGTLIPGDARLLEGEIKAPYCAGTFTATASVEYSYNVVGATSLALMNREYYDELRRQEKLVPTRELSVSSAGPFKLTLQADRNQPIPVTMNEADETQFKIFLGIVNERTNSEATIRAVESEFYLPRELRMTTPDACEDFVIDEKATAARAETDGFQVLKLKTPSVIELIKHELTDRASLDLKQDESTISGKKLVGIGPSDVRVFRCEVQYDVTAPGAEFDIERTLALRANISYDYRVKKKATFKVQNNAAEFVPVCEDLPSAEDLYVQDLLYTCGGEGAEVPPASTYVPVRQDHKIESTTASGGQCTVYAKYVDGDTLNEQMSEPNANIQEILPLTDVETLCSGSADKTDADCSAAFGDGWKVVGQTGSTINDIENGETTDACHICYKRGSENPLTDIEVVADDDETVGTRVGDAFELNNYVWADGRLVIYRGRSIVVPESGSDVCSGQVTLSLNPSSGGAGSTFTATVGGLANCDGESAFVSSSSTCTTNDLHCVLQGNTCAVQMTAPETTTNYVACVDINENNAFTEAGEISTPPQTFTRT